MPGSLRLQGLERLPKLGRLDGPLGTGGVDPGAGEQLCQALQVLERTIIGLQLPHLRPISV